MPRLSGAELITRLAAASPDTALVVYTAEADGGLAVDALSAGASAVVLKEAPLPDPIRAVEAALDGRTYVDSALAPSGGPRRCGRASWTSCASSRKGLSHEAIGERLEIKRCFVRSALITSASAAASGARAPATSCAGPTAAACRA
jgi:DNA-binding NtrC family response regulator